MPGLLAAGANNYFGLNEGMQISKQESVIFSNIAYRYLIPPDIKYGCGLILKTTFVALIL